MDRLRDSQEVSERRALLLALGEIPPDQLSAGRRQDLVQQLLREYRDEPNPGIHAAVRWLLGRWQEGARAMAQIDKKLISRGPLQGRRWYVNRLGQTPVVLGPDTFRVGSVPEEETSFSGETRHQRHIPRTFAIADREVTVAQFQRFWRERHRQDFPYEKLYSPEDRCPINSVSWYDAAAYCNWLSAKDGIPPEEWCYVRNAKNEYGEGMKMAPNFLALKGYRLPTEGEWEYACRARSATAWACGSSEELLGHYAWCDRNSLRMQPVGSKKPNDYGLFDMHGNAWEWCQGPDPYPKVEKGQIIKDTEDSKKVVSKEGSVLRGGAFLDDALCTLARPSATGAGRRTATAGVCSVRRGL